MPLKTFASKAFPRRKSSGNALEDLDAPSEGFRVLSQYEVAERKQERQDKEKTKSTGRLSAVRPFASPAQKGRHQSFDDDSGTSNRGSNSSSGANSALSRLYDTSSSARYSSSSTLPSSSTDQEDDNNIFAHKHHHTADNHTFSIRGAARTFTFGGRTQKSPILPPVPPLPADPEDNIFAPPLGGHTRDRSLTTTSSASTALPPKVDSLSLGMADFGGEFDDIFAGLDRRQSPKPNSLPKPPVSGIFRSESEPMLAVPPKVPPKAFATSRQLQAPDPIRIDKSKEIEPSPFSWDSRASHDGLLPSPHSPDSLLQDPLPAVPPHRQLTPSPSSPPTASRLAAPNAVQRKAVAKPASSRVPSDNSVNLPAAAASKASKASPSREFNPSVALTPTPGAGLFDSDQFSFVGSDDTPRPAAATLAKKPVTPEPDFMAVKPSAGNSPGSRPGANKVMNQAQFNKYRQHKEQEDAKATVESDSDASDGDYEQDEEERNKELQRQRRKQEGHLAVWRQQMHKVTGEKPLPFQQRTSIDRPMSQFDLFAPKKEQSDSDEGDEETPLAILMAHGFPTKTRPPTKPTGPFASKLPVESHSTTDLRLSMGPQSQAAPIVRPASSHGQRPSSIAGSGAAEKRSSALPAFARNLPPDPYFGASLVSAPNRESLAFGHAGPGSTYGGAGGAASSQNPAGQTLVNVIANEERAKAMRRGSPNAQNGFGPSAPSAPANSMNMNPGMPMQMQTPMGMGGMHMNSQSADMTQQMMAQLVLNQQYLQQQLAQSQALMMQMAQGQMGGMAQMQQMQHMQQMGGMPPMQAPGNPAFGQNRPMSLYSVGMPSQRAVSMVGMPQLPPMPSQQPSVGFAPSIALIPPPTNGYAPSIAPSERSTVGMARRYRPVSHMPGSVAGFDSTPTMTSSTLPPIPSDDGAPTKGNARPISKSGKKGILAVLKRSNKENQAEEDEDDWGGMTTRKSKWLSKGGDGGATKEPGLRELYVDGI